MRRAAALVLAVLVGFAVLAAASLGEHGTRECPGRVSCPGIRLPAPITIQAGYGRGSVSYRIGRDGRVRRIATTLPSTFPQDASWFGDGVWFAIRQRHLVIGRDRDTWRSRGEFPSRFSVGLVRAGSHAVAFSYGNNLYLAPLGGAERPIARAEFPLGFTSGGVYTNRWGHRLLLRSDTGAILKTIVRSPLADDYLVASGSLYFITHGVLMRARGARVQRLVSLRHLRLSARSLWMQPLGRLLELEDAGRLVLLRPDGSLFARTPLRGSEYREENAVSFLDIEPSASAVAFIVAAGQTSGTETVYVLRAGAHSAVPVYRQWANLAGCEHWARLEWHENWLLYNDVDGDLAAIDTTGAHGVTDLSTLARRLHGAKAGFSAYWSGQPRQL
jgi:hypothetical protein